MSAVSLTATAKGDHVALAASGSWTAERAAELERVIEEASRRHAGARSVDIDLARIERLDTFGAWLIERLQRTFATRGSAARITGLSDTDRALMEELRLANQVQPPRRAAPNSHFARARFRRPRRRRNRVFIRPRSCSSSAR